MVTSNDKLIMNPTVKDEMKVVGIIIGKSSIRLACTFLLYITLFSSEYYRIPPLLILLFQLQYWLLLTLSVVQESAKVFY